jgi:hypothetical protein
MNAYKIRSIVNADGTIVLKGIPFSIGNSVEVIVLDDLSNSPEERLRQRDSANQPPDERWKSLRGSVTRYDDPFEPAIPLTDWDVLQ